MELPDPAPAHLIDPAAPDAEDVGAYRLLAADIASGVAVVAARHRRRDVAATVTGFLDVSYDPPTMLVSLFEEGRICDAVESSGAWTLSVLRRDQEGTANWLASPGSPVEGLLDRVPFRRAPGSGAAITRNVRPTMSRPTRLDSSRPVRPDSRPEPSQAAASTRRTGTPSMAVISRSLASERMAVPSFVAGT